MTIKTNKYMESVVRVYRKAIDECISNPENYNFKNEWLDELLNIDHRELTTVFYLEENKDYSK